ncbi:NEL-type E3 ubiquitin ligase domain-containing protein (plasmid) [Edwardsiella ictaluri]|uniref:RING-type E3 ubiquitin transferase n=3 Tax=Enterobacterales TaxID=91347 RepID=Q9KI30_EDWIC|nr:NEL-type E3 ubiquitin ligase domain-containing protein [Edwardsiella ictaluri]AAF85955.1 unknown [Edwardsiella ictaluri]AGE98125.1 EseH [Edwardsiella ictaluri]AGE98128.1 EseH [Edwardsiella ictaluri]AGE98132.1 EseH [Edwardsiella ictaluri]AGQ03793.1 EseH [Edwardsiella ictaluri]
MPLHVGTGHIPATISNNRIHRIASANTPPEMSVRENIQEFFCSTHKSEALNCLWEICHPPVGTTRDAVAGRFEQLKRLAYPGYENNIQSGRNGDNSFCILDEDGQEMLSVILGDADTYTVIYPGGEMTHDLSLSAPQGDEGLLILGASDTVGPQTEGEYKAAWSAWERAAPPEEAEDRAKTVRELRHCLRYNTRLDVSNTKLTSLPPLPTGLKRLDVSGTGLTSLPPLPSKLQRLDISNTPMPRLPSLPSRLQRLDVSNTHLANLPEIIANLSQRTTVRLQSNSLSERTLQMINKPGYQGPRIVDMATSSNHQETRALHLAVADWLTPAEADEEASAKRWWAIGKEDDAAAFSTFLDRLKKTKNNQATDFHVQIASWISQLAQDDELRAKTFDMATESTSSCEDRVTLAMNNMKSVQLVHNAEKGKFDHDIPGLVSAGREMFRLEQLDLIAREKVKKLRFFDEIEVFLGYQNKLKESLELTGTTEGMQFFGASRITELDLKAAEIQVKSAENSQFREWILQWEPLHGVLKRRESKQWQTLIDKKMEDYEREYQQLSDTELKPAGLLGDIEAERTIGARAMASAEKAFQQGLHPLAEQLLGRHLEARWVLDTPPVYHSLA